MLKSHLKTSNNTRDTNWEYVKNRLFNGESEYVYKIKGPILIVLNNATKQDSIAVEKTISELKKILPNKTIDYFKNYTKVDFNNKEGHNKKIDNLPIYELYNSVIVLNFNAPSQFIRDLFNLSIYKAKQQFQEKIES